MAPQQEFEELWKLVADYRTRRGGDCREGDNCSNATQTKSCNAGLFAA